MWNSIKLFWEGLTPEIQAAVIGAVAVVGTATLGALAVVLQIGRQARHAIEQNRHNEALKLKMQVYEEIVTIFRDASHAEIELSSYVQKFLSDIALTRQMSRNGLPLLIPEARIPVLIEKSSALGRKSIEIIRLTERWQIIDSRIEIVRTATNVASYDINAAFKAFFNATLPIIPQEIQGHAQQGTLFPWSPPNDQTTEELERLGNDLLEALMNLGCYIHDFQVEMQNLLLGELFKQKLPPREPIDPNLVVVQFERYKELAEYFERETAWGRGKARIEGEVRGEVRSRTAENP